VCFLYPGQGSQSVNMLRDLVVGNPDLHHLFEAADEEVRDILERPLSSFVYPPPVLDGGEGRLREAVNATQVAQPAMAVADLFCHELLGRYRIEPAMVAGHSFGEYVALAAAGVVSARGLFRLSALRGRAAYRAGIEAGGGMAAVGAGLEATVAALAELGIEAHPANVNAPLQTVIGGTAEAIDAAVKQLPTKRISARRIPVTAAFHTPLLAAATRELGEHLATTDFRPPTRLVFSNTTGGVYPDRVEEIRDLLRRHLVEPVRFLDQVRAMHDRGARVFIEAGPGSVLTNLTVRILDGRPFTALAAAPNGQPGWQAWGALLGRLWSLGLPVWLERWFARRELPECGVEELVRRQRERAAGRPTDWIVNSSVARPVSGITQRRPATPSSTVAPATVVAPAATSAPSASPVAAAEPSPVPAATPAPPEQRRVAARLDRMPATPVPAPSPPAPSAHRPQPSQSQGAAMIDMPKDDRIDDRNVHEAAPPAGILEAQQRLMAQWLDLQMRHVEVSGRFLDSNERIVLACLNGAAAVGGLPAAVRPAALRAPVARAAATPPSAPAPDAVNPRPVAPAPPRPGMALPSRPVTPVAARPVPANGANGANGHHEAARPEPAVTRASPPPVAKPAAVTEGAADAPPPTEQFRRDLIAAVAERTGYPVEMLKEDALLEADLGIDSIKTVEIFGSLTEYHRFMPGGGGLDEELLGEFAQLKTLGDIIAMYDRGRSGGASAATPPERPTPTANGVAPTANGASAPANGAVPAVNGSHPAANGSKPAVNGSHPAVNGSIAAAVNGGSAAHAATPEGEAQVLERLEVRAVPAPAEAGGEKKNSPLTTSS
jgi:malonyl CoA-acyl carrier protein transacylase/acyl carrier protein